MTTRNCLQCQTPITGRNDKKYCSDDCRAVANHEKRKTSRQPTKSINDALWKNREILKTLWNQRPTLTTRDTLLSLGYQFNYYTSQHRTALGAPYYACYDYGFQPRIISGSNAALVVKMVRLSLKDPWEELIQKESSH